jgi:DNA polymerase-3 subunit alpha
MGDVSFCWNFLSMSDFVHLRAHSQSSIKDGMIPASPLKKKKKIGSLAKLAADDGQEAVALTDLAGLYSAVSFYADARSQGVKPVIGADVWVDPDVTQGEGAAPTRMVLIAQSTEGYRRLMDWMSRGYLDNLKKGIPAIRQSWMRDEGTTGIIALSGDMAHGEVAQAVLMDDVQEARRRASLAVAFYRQAFGDRYYLEVQRYDQPHEATQVTRLVAMARSTQTPLIATHPIQFATPEDFYLHELRYCVSNGEVISDPGRVPKFTAEQYFKSQKEMKEMFADLPEAVANTVQVARRCSTTIELGKNYLPEFPTQGLPVGEFLRQKSQEGLEARLLHNFPEPAEREAKRPEYQERLDRELGTINRMEFSGYFLIVADFIGWARANDILVGPGRGSGAGSLVAYALGITDIDPLPYNLLFERFLNPERVSMPDFDIDFEKAGRDRVIQYVIDKYGENQVAQIATLGTLGGRAAINGVGRAFGVNPRTIGIISALIPKKPGTTIHDAMFGNDKTGQHPIADLNKRYEREAEVRKIVDLAMALESAPTNVGVHASGLLIAPSTVSDFSPLYYDPASAGKSKGRSQYDGPSVELAGLVKFDFLGLKTLDIIKKAILSINKRPEFEGRPLSQPQIPLNDAKTFEALQKGDSVAVFQLESTGMQRMLKDARPDRFEDIVALVALFRPGPMSLIPTYCARKHGKEEVSYPDPRVQEVLKETYGIMVYQEQVMQMAQYVGGYTLGGADLLRRAMGKKKVDEMLKQRQMFREGAQKNGLSVEKADEIFDLMEKFAGYGFNKSHAAAYGLLAYQTAYLKINYPVEYYTAVMNYQALQKKHTDLEITILDARAHGLRILPPDINNPALDFSPAPGGIRYGMAGLKGVSENSVRTIIRVREEGGEFTEFMDFFRRVPRKDVNATIVKALVRVGAFDSIDDNRAALLATVPEAIKYAGKYATNQAKKEALLSATDLPDMVIPAKPRRARKEVGEVPVPPIEPMAPWSEDDRLTHEHAVAGFYISGHPFDRYAKELGGLRAAVPLRQIESFHPDRDPDIYLVAGVISDVFAKTKDDGSSWARVTLNDGEHALQLNIWSEGFDPNKDWIKKGEFLALGVRPTFDRRDGTSVQLSVDQVLSFDGLQERLVGRVHVALKAEDLPKLTEVVANHRQPNRAAAAISIGVHMPDPEVEGNYLSGELQNVGLIPTPALFKDLKESFGADRVHADYVDRLLLQPNRRPKFQNKNPGNRRSGPH